jgi:hypothetical protein
MREIAPGLFHWTAHHEKIGMEVSSYYLLSERVLVDPLEPPNGLQWFHEQGHPEHVLLTIGHHDRAAWRLRDAFGYTVHCPRHGLHRVEGRGPVEPYDVGNEPPGGVLVQEVGALCPDEMALYIPAHRALAVADGVVRWPSSDVLTFVPASTWTNRIRRRRGCARPTGGC